MELLELKKNPVKDLDRQWWLFFLIGLSITMLLTWLTFEYKATDNLETIDLGELRDEFVETIDIPVTEMPPPPPPVLQQPEIVEVPDDQEIKTEVETVLDQDIPTDVATAPAPVRVDAPTPPPVQEETEEIFQIVEEPSEFPGGMKEFYKYVGDKMEYPKQARRMGIEGKVFVQFVVDKDGSLTDVKVVKGIGGGCDEEAIRVLKDCPKWKPGKQRGRPVKQRMSLPIMFKLG